MAERQPSGELVAGTLNLLILTALRNDPMHGCGVVQFIQRRSDHVLRVGAGALYPALHQLEVRGLLASEWAPSENNRRAKYYRLTSAGRSQLAEEMARWNRMTAAIARIMEPV